MTRAAAPNITGAIKWVETRNDCPCPACGHGRHCTISEDGKFCMCRRGVESARPCKQKDGTTAYFHVVAQLNGAPVAGKIGKAKDRRPRLAPPELANIIKSLQTALSPDRLTKIARKLEVSERALKTYGIGYDVTGGAAAFPMYGGDRKPIGVRLRYADGSKVCIPGSRNGLFLPDSILRDGLLGIPEGIANDPAPLLLLMPEGPTDAAAAADLGFRAVGRPSNSGGGKEVCKLLGVGKRQEVVIVADRDKTKHYPDGTPYWPGIEGALSLADLILPVCGTLKMVKPPKRAKDLRDWFKQGGTANVLCDLIAESEKVTPAWLGQQRANLADCKRRLKQKVG